MSEKEMEIEDINSILTTCEPLKESAEFSVFGEWILKNFNLITGTIKNFYQNQFIDEQDKNDIHVAIENMNVKNLTRFLDNLIQHFGPENLTEEGKKCFALIALSFDWDIEKHMHVEEVKLEKKDSRFVMFAMQNVAGLINLCKAFYN